MHMGDFDVYQSNILTFSFYSNIFLGTFYNDEH